MCLLPFFQGREAAEIFADKNGMELSDEVIAGSNCFQFYRSPRRGRRSVIGDLTPSILNDKNVSWAEKQKPLVRIEPQNFQNSQKTIFASL